MKVLHIGPIPIRKGGKLKGGVESHISQLSLALDDVDIDSLYFRNEVVNLQNSNDVFSYNNTFERILYCIIGAIIYMFELHKLFPFRMKALKVLSDAIKIKMISRRNSVDVVHVHGLHDTAIKSCEFAGLACIATDHGIGHKIVFKDNIELVRNNLSNVSVIIAISDFSHENCLKLVNENKIFKINNPIDVSVNLKEEKKTKVIIDGEYFIFNGISEAWDRKGLKYIANEINDIFDCYKDLKFVCISEKAIHEKFSTYVSGEFKNRIIYVEPLSRNENLKLVQNALFNLAPSQYEGFSLAYLESIIMGTPVLGFASNITEMNKIFNVDFNVPFDFKLNKPILGSVTKVEFNARNACLRVDSELVSWKNNIHRFIDVYKRALELNRVN
ncbi:glycosyltransferase family 4 protein [Vibrio breoganii]